MNRIEKAYSLGYRATIDGKLYLNDKELPLYIRKKNLGRNLLYFWVPGINGVLYLSKLQAYQKYGSKAFEENCMYIDGNTLNCSQENITLKSVLRRHQNNRINTTVHRVTKYQMNVISINVI